MTPAILKKEANETVKVMLQNISGEKIVPFLLLILLNIPG